MDNTDLLKIPRLIIYGSNGFDELIRRFRTYTGNSFPVLFFDPSQECRYIAAEIIAAELGIDLYRSDMPAVVSANTDPGLAVQSVFKQAASLGALLFWDNADLLFERHPKHEYSVGGPVIEVKEFIRNMQLFEGIVILATKYSKNIDEAFMRAMRFVVEFPEEGIKCK